MLLDEVQLEHFHVGEYGRAVLTRPSAFVLVRRFYVRLEMRGREEEGLADGASVLLLHPRPRGTRGSGGRCLRRPGNRNIDIFCRTVAIPFKETIFNFDMPDFLLFAGRSVLSGERYRHEGVAGNACIDELVPVLLLLFLLLVHLVVDVLLLEVDRVHHLEDWTELPWVKTEG